MTKTIAQRELRNDNARVIAAVAAGETFVVTRNGVPVAELRPVQVSRRTLVPRTELAALVAVAQRSDGRRFRQDLDRFIDQRLQLTAGLLDTSVVVDWDDASVIAALPDETAVSAITLAELAAGPHLAATGSETASRQARLQQVEAMFEPLPFDAAAARSFGQIVAAVSGVGRSHRSRVADLLIAATAHANALDLYTRNPDDFTGLTGLVRVVGV